MDFITSLKIYKEGLEEKIKEKVIEVRKKEEKLNDFIVEQERIFFKDLVKQLNIH